MSFLPPKAFKYSQNISWKAAVGAPECVQNGEGIPSGWLLGPSSPEFSDVYSSALSATCKTPTQLLWLNSTFAEHLLQARHTEITKRLSLPPTLQTAVSLSPPVGHSRPISHNGRPGCCSFSHTLPFRAAGSSPPSLKL